MWLIYTKPKLKDLSHESRIAFVRQFRFLTQDDVSDKLGLTGDCKRRTMTRYERGDRNPKDERLTEIANILNVSFNSIKKYDYNNPIDLIYTLMWLEELIPNYYVNFSDVPNINELYIVTFKKFYDEWNIMRNKWIKREISYKEYIEWKLNYDLKEVGGLYGKNM